MDEGYIKFNPVWEKMSIVVPDNTIGLLNFVRSKLMVMNMIGQIPNGPGFGNISLKEPSGLLIITGTNTGSFKTLSSEHLSIIEHFDVEQNTVWCIGVTCASSETMSHAVIYQNRLDVKAVIHIHHEELWLKMKGKFVTTSEAIPYGTPQLAKEIAAIAKSGSTLPGTIVLGGHKDGVLFYGRSLEELLAFIIGLEGYTTKVAP